MSDYIKTTGIVIKRTNYKDADKILTVLTQELGKISCKAKGIRKITSKKRSHLEPGSIATIYLIKTYDRYLITQANSIYNIKLSETDYDVTLYLYSILEITDKLIPNDDPNPINFRLLKKALELFNQTPTKGLVLGYLIKLMKINGFYTKSEFIDFYEQMNLKNPELMKKIFFLEDSTFDDIVIKEKEYFEKTDQPILKYLKEKTDLFIKSYGIIE
ncbi:MAG: repair protein RecO [Patescibacteria group bacterium]|nr:repair protein RecO [Patescibacteria group bacterium]